jgi:hypothetical protein
MNRQTNKHHRDLPHPPKERNKKMMHRICDNCLKMESIDFGEMIDDAFYCTECDEENQKEMQKEDESNRIAWLARQKIDNEKENDK